MPCTSLKMEPMKSPAYSFDQADKLSAKPRRFKMEYNLIGKKVAEHMANGWNGINL